jgi:hypothetical protein
LFVALGLLLLGGCSSSNKACTLIGCGLPFEIRFEKVDGAWPAGTYDVSVTADGVAASCDTTLPFASCQTSSTKCTGTRGWDLAESGCALPAGQHSIAGIEFRQATPANVAVVVTLDGRKIGEGTFTPSYKTSQPNGPGCGDPCYGAEAGTLTLQP